MSKIQVSNVYDRLDQSIQQGYRVHILEGGSRSSKTWSIIQRLLIYAQQNPNTEFTICRQKMTWLRITLLKDFEEITRVYNIPVEPEWNGNRPSQEYKILGCGFTFLGLDEPQKLHGRKQDIAWINEAMEANIADFDQLEMRTNRFMILDYNPSQEDHWIFDRVEPREDANLFRSTQLDNPFLPEAIRKKIMGYEPTEENKKRGTADETNWKIYGLGVRAQQKGLIFTNWRIVKELPSEYKKRGIGLDFGFTNDPTAIVEMRLSEGKIWMDELCYQTELTNPEIARLLPTDCVTVADSAEPKSIVEIKQKGINVRSSVKGPDSVRQGIQKLQQYELCVTERSINLIRELKNYKWKVDNNGKVLNVPIDNFNHLLDAARYGAQEIIYVKRPFAIA
jgi:phage terminase large subunit